MSFEREYWNFVIVKMGGKSVSASSYNIYNRVEISFNADSVYCVFTPSKGEQWKENVPYSNNQFKTIVENYLFVAWLMQNIDDYEYRLPAFMQRYRTDKKIFNIKQSIEKYHASNYYKIKYLEFNQEIKHWSKEYIRNCC